MTKWLTRAWWQYLLTGCKGWGHFWCRVRGHPNGVWWYNYSQDATEPDMRCKDCDEDLG